MTDHTGKLATPDIPEAPDRAGAISLRGLSRWFGRRVAVDRIDLDVPAGSTTALIGLNGAGKSTAIRMLVGLMPPSEGTASVLGHDVAAEPLAVKQLIGYVPDRPTAYPWMKVREVIDFCRVLRPGWDPAHAADLTGLFRLDPAQKVKRLSKGQAAKLSLLVAMAYRPPVLILDEPTDGMDPLARDEFLDGVLRTVTDERDEGRTVLLSSHALGEAQRLADRVAIMHEGCIIHNGPMDDLLESTKRIRAVLPDRPGNPAHAPAAPDGTLCQRVDRREWTITVRGYSPGLIEKLRAENDLASVEVFDLSLDDVFKDLIRGRMSGAALEVAA